MKVDSESARRSFRVWTHSNDHKNRFFERIINLMNQFITYFQNGFSKIIKENLDKTDFSELLLSLKWLTILCQNGKNWQDYLSSQDNSAENHNIIRAVVELVRTCVIRYKQEYVLVLLRVIVRFIIGTINGRNEDLARLYANSGLIKY